MVTSLDKDGYHRLFRKGHNAKLAPGQASRNRVLAGYRKSARQRTLVWSLSDTDFDRITSEDCRYCGQAPSKTYSVCGNGSFIYNGLDRFDNTQGYVAENVVPCCEECNWAKGTMTADGFVGLCRRVSIHNEKIKCP